MPLINFIRSTDEKIFNIHHEVITIFFMEHKFRQNLDKILKIFYIYYALLVSSLKKECGVSDVLPFSRWNSDKRYVWLTKHRYLSTTINDAIFYILDTLMYGSSKFNTKTDQSFWFVLRNLLKVHADLTTRISVELVFL